MSFFDDLREALGLEPSGQAAGDGGAPETSARPQARRQTRPQERPMTAGERVSMMGRDLAFGFGLSDEEPYGYAERTAATQERQAAEAAAEAQRDDGGDEVAKGARPEPVAETAGGAEPAQDIGVPKGTRDGAAVAGAKEAGRRGRRAAIATSPRGLLGEAETTGRRSLMGLIK